MGYLGRDVEVVSLNQTQFLVVSCDSCGAIGMKELDAYKISPFITGKLTIRVVLLEVLCTGGRPKMLTVAISNEPSPTGNEILKGVKDELASVGLDSLPMAISTEKNMPTRQTGLGVSVIGVAEKGSLRIGTTQLGDKVYCLGLPKVGPELSNPEDPEIIQIKTVLALLDSPNIHDLVPVGSKGIRFEAEQLASSVNAQISFAPNSTLDLDKSAGPSTCLIFSVAVDLDEKLFSSLDLPLALIGKLY